MNCFLCLSGRQDRQHLAGMFPVPGSFLLGVEGGEKGRGFWKGERTTAGCLLSQALPGHRSWCGFRAGPLTRWVTLGWLLNLLEPQFPHP